MSWSSLQEVHNLRQDVLTSPSLPQGYLPPTKNGAEPKRPSRPINITPLARLSATVPNTIVVNWSSEFGRVSKAGAGHLEEPVGCKGASSSVLGWGNIFLFVGLSALTQWLWSSWDKGLGWW